MEWNWFHTQNGLFFGTNREDGSVRIVKNR